MPFPKELWPESYARPASPKLRYQKLTGYRKTIYDLIVKVWLEEHRLIPEKEIAAKLGLFHEDVHFLVRQLKSEGWCDEHRPQNMWRSGPTHYPIEYIADVPAKETKVDPLVLEMAKERYEENLKRLKAKWDTPMDKNYPKEWRKLVFYRIKYGVKEEYTGLRDAKGRHLNANGRRMT